jgi:hypothetical protein
MAFTYDLTTNVGKVRLLVPDNDSAAHDLEDAEISYFLTQTGASVEGAAVRACKWLARKYSKKASFSADGLSMQHTARAQEFAKRAAELESELFGGMVVADIDRQDGYSDEAAQTDYDSRTVYIKV